MRGRSIAFLMLYGLATSGCGIAEHMDIRAGMEPKFEDEDVRFRTTYYFRVFDICRANARGDGYSYDNLVRPASDLPGNQNIRIDSLYRFRMTGKAHPLANRIRFESGTLQKWEIDPFGATVRYDRESARFEFASPPPKDGAERITLIDRIRELAKLRVGMVADGDAAAAQAISEVVVGWVRTLRVSAPVPGVSLPADIETLANQFARSKQAFDGLKEGDDGAERDAVRRSGVLDHLGTASTSLTAAGPATKAVRHSADDLRASIAEPAERISRAHTALALARHGPEELKRQYASATGWLTENDKDNPSPAAVAGVLAGNVPAEESRRPFVAFTSAAVKLRTAALALRQTGKEDGLPNARAYEAAATYLEEVAYYDVPERLQRLRAALEAYDAALVAARILMGTGDRAGYCENGHSRRGFQVLGPEGWRTFDQDERLIMAMSSSNRKLIGALRELSSRFLREQPVGQELLLPIAEERLRVSEARRAVDLDAGKDPAVLLGAVTAIIAAPDAKPGAGR